MSATTSATPLLDRLTIARLLLDDFPLSPDELEILRDPQERYRLEDALREVADFDRIASDAVELWRDRRGAR